MRRGIPNNHTNIDYENLTQCYVQHLYKKQGDNVKSIILTGSYARGDAFDSSDLDIWSIFKVLDINILREVGEITRNLPVNYKKCEVNTQCLTINEFNSGYFSHFLAKPIIYYEGILLYGEDVCRSISKSEITETYKRILAETLLSVRHYISVDEQKEKLTYPKLKTYILKPLLFALRLERQNSIGVYPLSTYDLLLSYKNNDCEILLQWFRDKEKLMDNINKDHNYVLERMNNIIVMLLYN